jgi:hypothetical protein
MATEIELNTKINTANSAQSIGELRKALKDLVSAQADVGAGSANFNKLADAINKTEGRIGDLQDSFTTLRGSGVERLNSSIGLLREGLVSGDIDKAKIAFKGLGTAMSAVPIFLLIEGVKALYDNFDKILPAFKEFFNLQSATEKEIANLTKELEKQKKVNEAIFVGLENQIKLLEAQGASEGKILAVKKQLTEAKIKEAELDVQLQKAKIKDILLNDTLTESIEKQAAAYYRAQGNNIAADAIDKKIQQSKNERIKEASDALRTDLINIQNLKTNQQVEEIKQEKKVAEEKKKINDKYQEDLKKAKEDLFNDSLEEDNKQNEKDAENAQKQFEKTQEENTKIIEQRDALYQQNRDNEIKAYEQGLAEKKRIADDELKIEQQKDAARFAIAQSGIQAIQGLSDLAFSIRQANTKKGTAEEEKALRKQFQVNKALQIANATVSGAQGILQAATAPSGVPIPFDIPFRVAKAVAIGATTAATIAKISATQFQGASGSAGGGAQISGGSGGGGVDVGSGASVPRQNIQGLAFNNRTVGQVGQPGGGNTPNNSQPQVIKVVQIESEVTAVQNKVKTIQSIAKFP